MLNIKLHFGFNKQEKERNGLLLVLGKGKPGTGNHEGTQTHRKPKTVLTVVDLILKFHTSQNKRNF